MRGGVRAGAGRPKRAPFSIAQAIFAAAERYCRGIGGDPDGLLDSETAWNQYLSRVGLAGAQMAKHDVHLASQVSFQMLSRAAQAAGQTASRESREAVSGRYGSALLEATHEEEKAKRSKAKAKRLPHVKGHEGEDLILGKGPEKSAPGTTAMHSSQQRVNPELAEEELRAICAGENPYGGRASAAPIIRNSPKPDALHTFGLQAWISPPALANLPDDS